ncbi:hypothetical protein Aph01nite_34200 [Acrocarpospora phusangensis]|uniref:Uncharacterized protein n=1 Tax=Acrocarpospora phusangensis TaxID=1070424 RepID=A0A919QD02_9ACTN|nr:hypothetical protein [Acrocarpospora phusangensis]GIH25110.1 hypothetical protein Aph01nite_34200 [Acrocarpospora phusangensis]
MAELAGTLLSLATVFVLVWLALLLISILFLTGLAAFAASIQIKWTSSMKQGRGGTL